MDNGADTVSSSLGASKSVTEDLYFIIFTAKYFEVYSKKRLNFSLENAIKSLRVIRVFHYSSFNPRVRWGLGSQRHAPAVLTPENRPGTYCTVGSVGLKGGLDGCGRIAFSGIRSPDRPAHNESLYGLRKFGAMSEANCVKLYVVLKPQGRCPVSYCQSLDVKPDFSSIMRLA